MTEAFPRLWSTRFRRTLQTAFAGAPVQALAGLYWFATRRRVRGWSILLSAAGESRHYYAHWIAEGEQAEINRFRNNIPIEGASDIRLAVVAGEGASAVAIDRSENSLRRSFPDRDGASCAVLDEQDSLRSLLSSLPVDASSVWLLPMMAGDTVSPNLADILSRVLPHSSADVVFWDEDRIIEGQRSNPWIKPSWDEDFFSRRVGLVGASAVRVDALRHQTAGLDLANVGDDLEQAIFRVACNSENKPVRIPLVLTHRAGTQRSNRAAALPAQAPDSWPRVSIIIPTRDRSDLLKACWRSLEQLTYDGDLEAIIVDNGSSEQAALDFLRHLEANDLARVLRLEGPFNFSKLNNAAAAVATGEVLCLLNNDVEAQDSGWLSAMVSHALRHGVGAVGALLLYPDRRVQHAGVVIGLGRAAGHVQKGVMVDDERFESWHRVTREVSAVTAAAMVLKRDYFVDVGGFDEDAFPVAFNDVDLCLRLKQRGLRNLFVAEARLIHRESVSRGEDRSAAKAARFARELKALQDRWNTEQFEDPHFSPLFSKSSERCVLRI